MGLSAREAFLLEELRWYFQDSKAAQSGLRSVQAGFEAQMLAPAQRSGRATSFDGRTGESIRRARHIEQTIRLAQTTTKFRVREYFKERQEHKVFGRLAGLFPSARPLWHAYRTWGRPGGMDDFLHWLAAEAVKPKPPFQVRRLIQKAELDCQERLREALADFRGAWRRKPVRPKTKAPVAHETASGTG